MIKKTGIIKDLVDRSFVEYMLQHYERLPKKDNGLRWNADTMIEQEFNHKFKERVSSVIREHFNGDICHCTIYSDYSPGGIHSDGYIDKPEQLPLSYTILIPLISEYSENATVIFNESSNKAITYNEATGLGNKGIRSYEQVDLPAGNNISKSFIEKFFPHLSVSTLPFTLDSVLYWRPGSALYWPRERFHASAWFPANTIRKGMVILTNENR